MSHAAVEIFTLNRKDRRQVSVLRFMTAILILNMIYVLAVGTHKLLTEHSLATLDYPWFVYWIYGCCFLMNWSRHDSLMRTISEIEVDHQRGEIRYAKWTGSRSVVQFADIRSVTHAPASDKSPFESIRITLQNGRRFFVSPKYFNGSAATLLETLERARSGVSKQT